MNMCRNIYKLVRQPFKTGTIVGSVAKGTTEPVQVMYQNKKVDSIP